jgi:hypothetical protein
LWLEIINHKARKKKFSYFIFTRANAAMFQSGNGLFYHDVGGTQVQVKSLFFTAWGLMGSIRILLILQRDAKLVYGHEIQQIYFFHK